MVGDIYQTERRPNAALLPWFDKQRMRWAHEMRDMRTNKQSIKTTAPLLAA